MTIDIDLWTHADGSAHSTDGPLGCLPCANLRRAATPSKRKPHSQNAGYVCELKSKHPKLPGHFVIYDRDADPAPDIDADHRWIVMHEPSSTHVSCSSLKQAHEVMKDAAEGSDWIDFGQHDVPEQPVLKDSTQREPGTWGSVLSAHSTCCDELRPTGTMGPALSQPPIKRCAASCSAVTLKALEQRGLIERTPLSGSKSRLTDKGVAVARAYGWKVVAP